MTHWGVTAWDWDWPLGAWYGEHEKTASRSWADFFLDEVPQLSRFNGENCACTNGIAKQRYIRSNSFATE